jgi:hypothetical protein
VPKRVGRVEPAAGRFPGDTDCSRVDKAHNDVSKYTSYNAGLQPFAIGIFGTHSNKQYPTGTLAMDEEVTSVDLKKGSGEVVASWAQNLLLCEPALFDFL